LTQEARRRLASELNGSERLLPGGHSEELRVSRGSGAGKQGDVLGVDRAGW